MTDKTIKARQSRLKKSNEEKGLVQVKVWIPAHKRQRLLKLMAKWRREHDSED
jgi:hypothetical protein